MSNNWPVGRTYEMHGFKAQLSAPVLVGRSTGYYWFPTVARLDGKALMATMNNYADAHVAQSTAEIAFSEDDGLTWSPAGVHPYGDVAVTLDNGDRIFLPYYLNTREGGMGAPFTRLKKGSRTLETVASGVTVTGWPRGNKLLDNGACGFVFNGQAVRLKDGSHLTTLYGTFEGDEKYSLVAASSRDGVNWTVGPIVAGPEHRFNGWEGPCESALCRLRDGRLLIMFRVGAMWSYGATWSSDEGRTWSTPRDMTVTFSVQPGLAVLTDGMVVLAGGRPGPHIWFDATGTGENWQRLSMWDHHDALVPTGEVIGIQGRSSSYTEVVALDDRNLLYIYDRIPWGWSEIPAGTTEVANGKTRPTTNSVWVVRVTIVR
ncbi:MAG: glycoside hydrolase [Planctomycetes bacterium]|nr:glycoside hydrolase [Planctomycetota bacterium]